MERGKILFMQVREDLCKRISQGEFPLDSQLPTEAELIKRYGVSITTIRKAVQTLADEGVVAKRQGMGTFVTRYPNAEKPSPGNGSEGLMLAALLPDTTRLTKEGDSRHWALNLRRLNGISSAAAMRKCHVLVHGFNESLDFGSFAGVVMIASYAYSMESEDLRRKIAAELDVKGVPYVTISEFDPRFASKWWVSELTELEFFKATNYLLGKGRRRIALLGPSLNWSNPRYAGYRKALEAAKVSFDENLVIENPDSDEPSGRAACAKLLDRGVKGLDSIFCTTDLQAYGAMDCLLERGISIPDEISLMGVDNLSSSNSCAVPLTSVEFSGPELGEAAVELLLEAREGRHPNGRTVSCPGRIIERASVAEKI